MEPSGRALLAKREAVVTLASFPVHHKEAESHQQQLVHESSRSKDEPPRLPEGQVGKSAPQW